MPIKVLSDLDHVRERLEMYAGTRDSYYPEVKEAVDNAIDEVINDFANKIEVIVQHDENNIPYVIVKDNGRGIEIENKEYKDIPVILATKLFSGGKFDAKLYTSTVGLNGIGMTLINAVSYKFVVTTKYKNKAYKYEFKRSEFINKEILPVDTLDGWSTIVEMTPDLDYVSPNLEKDLLKERLEALKTMRPDVNVTLIWDDKQIKLKNIKDAIIKKMDIYGEYKSKRFSITLGYKLDENSKYYYGIVNSTPVHRGTHIRVIEKFIKRELFKIAQKKKLHIKEDDTLVGLRFFTTMILNKIAFASQHKNELSTPEADIEKLIKGLKITDLFTEEQIDTILDRLQSYRISLESKKAVRRSNNRSTNVKGLRDTNNKLPVEERELFIVEGESAGGTAISVRDVAKHAILPLRGKIINVLNMGAALKSDIVQSIFKSLGVTPNSDDLSNLRYGNVFILTDPDPDGKHIALLLVALFELMLPKLVEEGRLHVIEVPLYGKTVGGKFYPIFDPTEDDLKDKNVHRFKGLGEMDPHELYEVALNPETRRFVTIEKSHRDEVIKVMKEK